MSYTHHDRLTALDTTFLTLEDASSHMHVGSVGVFDGAPLRDAHGGLDMARIMALSEAALARQPRFRQKLAHVPLLGRPVWVDDERFNLHYHVRHAALPPPGDERQLKRLVGRIMSQQLDRGKPLWEMWYVEGLRGGRFAVIAKVHHCMVDGMSSVDLLNVLLQLEPSDEIQEAPDWVPRPGPTSMDLAAEAIGQLTTLPRSLGDTVRRTLQDAQDPRSDLRARLRAVRDSFADTVRTVSATPLNRPIGPHRRFDWHRMPLAEIKAVKNALGGTLNDVVLATVSGAIRRFLERHRVDVDTLDFRVMAPVSVRSTDERGTLGNRVSAWMVPLPLGERDPRAALAAIRQTTEHLKESKEAMGAEVLTQVGEWTPSTLLSLASRMMTRALPFNLVVTNVPGPQLPLYLMSARMLDNFGLIPLTDYLCLGIVLFSYDGQLCWGFTCEWDLLPDLHDFVLDVRAAFDDLQAAAAAATSAEATQRRKPSVRKPKTLHRRGAEARRRQR